MRTTLAKFRSLPDTGFSALRFAMYVGIACAMAVSSSFAAEEGDAPADPAKWYKGSLQVGIDASADDEDSNVVLDQYLRLEIRPPQVDKLSINGAFWLTEDVDGHESKSSALGGVLNTYGAAVQARIIRLYAEYEDLWGDSTLRVGRQRILDSPVYGRIDGVYFKQRHAKWDWYAFGGARASIYRDAHDDWSVGGGASVWVLPKTRVGLDWYYGEDQENRNDIAPNLVERLLNPSYPRRIKEEIDSRQLSLTLHQYLGANHKLFGRYTWFDGRSDELVLALSGVSPERTIAYDVTYRRRLYLLEDRTNDTTGFFRILGTQDEFDDIRAAVHIPITKIYGVSLEGQLHDADSDGGEGTANRDFSRMGIILHGADIRPGIDGNVGIDYWRADEGEGRVAVTGDVTKRWEKASGTVGVDFARYKDRIRDYNPNLFWLNQAAVLFIPGVYASYTPLVYLFDVRTVDTRENVYSVYTQYRRDLAEDQHIAMRLTFEDDDGPDSPYWRLKLSYTLEF